MRFPIVFAVSFVLSATPQTGEMAKVYRIAKGRKVRCAVTLNYVLHIGDGIVLLI